MKPEDTRAQKSEPHETAASTGRRDDGHDQKAGATEASIDRPRDTADENAGGCSHPALPAGDSAGVPDNGDDELSEFDELTEEQVVTKADHLEDQIQQLKSTVAILKSLAGVERPVDEVGELFNTETCNTDDDWEYLLALVGEAARQDIDDPYDRAAYVVDRWCYELLHEPDAPNGGSYEFVTDGGYDPDTLVLQRQGGDWHVFDEPSGESLCAAYEFDETEEQLEHWPDADQYEADRDCEECCRKAGILDEPEVATDGGSR